MIGEALTGAVGGAGKVIGKQASEKNITALKKNNRKTEFEENSRTCY